MTAQPPQQIILPMLRRPRPLPQPGPMDVPTDISAMVVSVTRDYCTLARLTAVSRPWRALAARALSGARDPAGALHDLMVKCASKFLGLCVRNHCTGVQLIINDPSSAYFAAFMRPADPCERTKTALRQRDVVTAVYPVEREQLVMDTLVNPARVRGMKPGCAPRRLGALLCELLSDARGMSLHVQLTFAQDYPDVRLHVEAFMACFGVAPDGFVIS